MYNLRYLYKVRLNFNLLKIFLTNAIFYFFFLVLQAFSLGGFSKGKGYIGLLFRLITSAVVTDHNPFITLF